MKANLWLASIFAVVLFTGCTKPHQALFVEVVQDHRVVTVETLTSVKKTIQDEMASRDLTEDQENGMNQLLDRIDTIMRGSEAIDDYVSATMVDEELLAKLLNSRWKRRFDGE